MWLYLDFSGDLAPVDLRFSACMFGADYQKHTRLRCWNWSPTSLSDQRCSLKGESFSCGRARELPHVPLGFGSASTADAAAYSPGLCQAWASDVRLHFDGLIDPAVARGAVGLTASGPVRRHKFRGEVEDSAKEARDAEDQICSAGCRNPADLSDVWPQLWATMEQIRSVLRRAWVISSDLRGLSDCCGPSPTRSPPLAASVLAVRHELERVFEVPAGVFDDITPPVHGGRS